MYGEEPAICIISHSEIDTMIAAKRESLKGLAQRCEAAMRAADTKEGVDFAGDVLRDTNERLAGLAYLKEHVGGASAFQVTVSQLSALRAALAPIDPGAVELVPEPPLPMRRGMGLNGPVAYGAETACKSSEARFRPWG